MKKPSSATDPLWFKDAIIYEIHVRAFADSTPTASATSRASSPSSTTSRSSASPASGSSPSSPRLSATTATTSQTTSTSTPLMVRSMISASF